MYVISWSKDLEYVKLKHKSSYNYSFFHAQPEKKQIHTYAYAYVYAAMLHVSLGFGWLAYLEDGGGSWICAREQVEAAGGSTVSVNGAPN